MQKILAEVVRFLTDPIAQLRYKCPQRFLLVKAERPKPWVHPRSWRKSMLNVKLRLYFVCEHSNEPVESPIKLWFTKDWVEAIAPAFKVGEVLLWVAEAAGKFFGIENPFKGICLTAVDDDLKKLLIPNDRKAQTLPEEAYELVAEKASMNNGWRKSLVRIEVNGDIMWVKNGYEEDVDEYTC